MDYNEAVEILKSFNEQYPNLIFEKNIRMVSFEENLDNEYVLNVKVDESINRNLYQKKIGLPKEFIYKGVDNKRSKFKVSIQYSEEISAHSVKAGTKAKHINLAGYGTYGWGFILDGAPVALSNWHVFCPDGNNTALGSRILLDGFNIASLSYIEPMGDTTANKWDMALAKFDNIDDFVKAFTPCENGINKPYPNNIQSAKLTFGTSAYKVGARQPICRDGIFKGVADIRVKYNDNVSRYFVGQLLFSKMSDPGDSGSVIVNANTNQIIGLNFAGNNNDTFANPLFIYDRINYLGTKYISENLEIPIYETNIRRNNNSRVTFDEKSIFPNSSLIPPSLGGVYGTFSTVEINNGMGRYGTMGGITVTKIIDTYGFWLKVKYTKDEGSNNGYMPRISEGEGWINTNAPTVLYL